MSHDVGMGMGSQELKARAYGSLVGRSIIFFSEFIEERSGDPRDEEWVARARELRGRMLFELGHPAATLVGHAKESQKNR